LSPGQQCYVPYSCFSLLHYPLRCAVMSSPFSTSTMPSSALTKSPSLSSTALMPPPPPPKRIKRPPKVLDEDDYTEALSQIIARDYFPGLLESKTQQEYLTALESNNPLWIAEAGAKLQEVMTPGPHTRSRQARAARNSRFNTPLPGNETPKDGATLGATPRGFRGDETPGSSSVAATDDTLQSKKSEIDTATLSLSAFQAKYTSEDNESFNALLDKQNTKRRKKHAHLWTTDQRIPSARQIAHRTREAKLLKEKAENEASGKALVPITTGAEANRPARPDSWKMKRPDNTFMFPAGSVDEDGIETVAEARERTSRAGPKAVVYANTRLPPPTSKDDDSSVRPSPSLSAVRDAIAGRPRLSASEIETGGDGSETPRVNGYAFVDEEKPENVPQEQIAAPTYQDLLAGQVGDAMPNPFKIGEMRKREDLHHRMVEREARKKKRARQAEMGVCRVDVQVPTFASSPMIGVARTPGVAAKGRDGGATGTAGGLTPAAKRLLDRVGRTPVSGLSGGGGGGGEERSGLRNMWTPTPRSRASGRQVD
jgi:protein DGCR14